MPYATRDQIAQLLKLTPRMVNKHVKDNGMPIVGRGEYDLVACVHWYIGFLKDELRRARRGDETEQQARARLVKATANLRELEYARVQGELISVETVAQLWERLVIAFKNKILAIPSKLPQKLIGCQDLADIKSTLEAELYEALSELSVTEIDIPPIKEPEETYATDHPTRRPSTKAHRKRVGRQKQNTKSRVKRRTRKVANRKG